MCQAGTDFCKIHLKSVHLSSERTQTAPGQGTAGGGCFVPGMRELTVPVPNDLRLGDVQSACFDWKQRHVQDLRERADLDQLHVRSNDSREF